MPDTDIKQEVVLLIHGIRTRSPWQVMVKSELEEIPGIEVVPTDYGYFDLLRFWCPFFTRQRAINEVKETIQEIQEANRNAKISVIAHSNGTYIITKLLRSERNITLHRLVLCGSVVSRRYPWADVKSRISNKVVNDYGTRDVWPVAAKVLSWGYGDTGRHRFGKQFVIDRGHDFAHSDYFKNESGQGRDFVRKFWKPLFQSGKVVASSHTKDSPMWLNLFSLLPGQWCLVIAILCLVGWCFAPTPIPIPVREFDLRNDIGQIVANDLEDDGAISKPLMHMVNDRIRFSLTTTQDQSPTAINTLLLYDNYPSGKEIKVQIFIEGNFRRVPVMDEQLVITATLSRIEGEYIRGSVYFTDAVLGD